jgi:hypothetical protein
MEISIFPHEIPPTLQNPRSTPLPTATGKNRERLDPKKRSETAETHPSKNSSTHASPPTPSRQENQEASRNQPPDPGTDPRTGLGNRTVPAGASAPAQIPATPSNGSAPRVGSSKKKKGTVQAPALT